jgi:hypothetical protein
MYFFRRRQTFTTLAAFLRRTHVGEWPTFVAPMCAILLEKAVTSERPFQHLISSRDNAAAPTIAIAL